VGAGCAVVVDKDVEEETLLAVESASVVEVVGVGDEGSSDDDFGAAANILPSLLNLLTTRWIE